jgi:hypothetical protein
VREIIPALPAVLSRPDPVAAHIMACHLPEESLPEKLVLFNTPGLTRAQTADMLKSVFGKAANPALARENARLGRYGFSFPQWRFLTQSFNGAALVERFGMERPRRDTDVLDPKAPDPARDLFGAGFVHEENGLYIEYRRAYIACADKDAALVIRNNSWFFGRDRLPAPVYVSERGLSPEAMCQLTPASFARGGAFERWQDAPSMKAAHLLDALDDFDMRLSAWLRAEGKDHLAEFLRHKTPYIAGIDPQMPPWLPKFSLPATPDVLPQLDDLFGARPGAKMVLLSGPTGDLPVTPPVRSRSPAYRK